MKDYRIKREMIEAIVDHRWNYNCLILFELLEQKNFDIALQKYQKVFSDNFCELQLIYFIVEKELLSKDDHFIDETQYRALLNNKNIEYKKFHLLVNEDFQLLKDEVIPFIKYQSVLLNSFKENITFYCYQNIKNTLNKIRRLIGKEIEIYEFGWYIVEGTVFYPLFSSRNNNVFSLKVCKYLYNKMPMNQPLSKPIFELEKIYTAIANLSVIKKTRNFEGLSRIDAYEGVIDSYTALESELDRYLQAPLNKLNSLKEYFLHKYVMQDITQQKFSLIESDMVKISGCYERVKISLFLLLIVKHLKMHENSSLFKNIVKDSGYHFNDKEWRSLLSETFKNKPMKSMNERNKLLISFLYNSIKKDLKAIEHYGELNATH